MHISPCKTYAFTLQKLWFYSSKHMVSHLKNYGFATQNLCFFQQTSDFFVQEQSVFDVIVC